MCHEPVVNAFLKIDMRNSNNIKARPGNGRILVRQNENYVQALAFWLYSVKCTPTTTTLA